MICKQNGGNSQCTTECRLVSVTNPPGGGTHSADATQLSRSTSVDFLPLLLLPPTTHHPHILQPPSGPPPFSPAGSNHVAARPPSLSSAYSFHPPPGFITFFYTFFFHFFSFLFCFTTARGGDTPPHIHHPLPLLCLPAQYSSWPDHLWCGGALSCFFRGHLAIISGFFSPRLPRMLFLVHAFFVAA